MCVPLYISEIKMNIKAGEIVISTKIRRGYPSFPDIFGTLASGNGKSSESSIIIIIGHVLIE